MTKLQITFVSLLISFIIAVFMLFCFELALRHISPEKVRFSLYRPDKDLRLALKPNIKIRKGDVLFQTNANSFRGGPLMADPEKRIIVYGDSNVLGEFANLEQTFPYKLEKYLKDALGKRIEVINAGVQGYGPDQYLIKFEKDAKKFRPDMVIFVVFADNDFGDSIRNKIFELDPQGNLVRTPNPSGVDQALQDEYSFKGFLSSLLITEEAKKIRTSVCKTLNINMSQESMWRPVNRYEELSREDKVRHLAALSDREFIFYKELKPGQFSVFSDHYDIDIALNPGGEAARVKIRLMNAVLKKADEFARSNNIEFLVLILPSNTDLSTDSSVYGFSYKDLQKFPRYDRTNLTRSVERICISNRINYINLFYPFLQNDPESLYIDGDNHWSAPGEDLSAKTVLHYIISNKLLEK